MAINEKQNNVVISNLRELITICVKSKTFDLLFVLMVSFVWWGNIMLKRAVDGKDSTSALLAIYVWPVLICVFLVTMYSGMLVVTRGTKKRLTVEFIFALLLLLIAVGIILGFLFTLSSVD